MPDSDQFQPCLAKKTHDGVYVITDSENLQSVVVDEDSAVLIARDIIHQSPIRDVLLSALEQGEGNNGQR